MISVEGAAVEGQSQQRRPAGGQSENKRKSKFQIQIPIPNGELKHYSLLDENLLFSEKGNNSDPLCYKLRG